MAIKRINSVSNLFGYTETVAGYAAHGPSGAPSPWYNSAERRFPSQNPVVDLGGRPFRYPSQYSRFVRNFDTVRSSRTSRPNGWSYPGNNTTGMILASNLPTYWDNNRANFDSNLRNKSATLALNSIASRKASAGVSLGESIKASSMIADTSITLIRALIAAKKFRWKEVERLLGLQGSGLVLTGRYPANKWLEYQYGWKPLLSDLHTQYGIIKDGLEGDAFLTFGKGSAHRETEVSDEIYDSFTRLYHARKRKGEQVCITKLVAKLSSENWRKAGKVGMLNPLEVVWELVPFSFILDWFMPVGNVLEALTARAGITFVSGSTTFLTGGDFSLTPVRLQGAGGIYQRGYMHGNVFFHDRFVLNDWPSPFFYFEESPFSTKRTINALALWRSLISGRGIPRHVRA